MVNRPSGVPPLLPSFKGPQLAFLLAPKRYTVGRPDTTGKFTSHEESPLRQHVGEQCTYGPSQPRLSRTRREIVPGHGEVYITALSDRQVWTFRRLIVCCRSVRRFLNGLDCCTRFELPINLSLLVVLE